MNENFGLLRTENFDMRTITAYCIMPGVTPEVHTSKFLDNNIGTLLIGYTEAMILSSLYCAMLLMKPNTICTAMSQPLVAMTASNVVNKYCVAK